VRGLLSNLTRPIFSTISASLSVMCFDNLQLVIVETKVMRMSFARIYPVGGIESRKASR